MGFQGFGVPWQELAIEGPQQPVFYLFIYFGYL